MVARRGEEGGMGGGELGGVHPGFQFWSEELMGDEKQRRDSSPRSPVVAGGSHACGDNEMMYRHLPSGCAPDFSGTLSTVL